VRTRAAEGHLGLQLLTELVQEGGGRLAVDAAPGRGTTVRVEVDA
jgi:signal transduction histidine kinase